MITPSKPLAPVPSWHNLPDVLQARIVHQLPLHGAAQIACVSKEMLAHVQSDARWHGLAPSAAKDTSYKSAQAALRRLDCGAQSRKLLRAKLDCPAFNKSVQLLGLEKAFLWRAVCDWQMSASLGSCEDAMAIEHVATQIFVAYGANAAELDFTFLRITSLPECLGILTGLKKLTLVACTKLEALPTSLGRLTALQELDLAACQELRALPPSLGRLHKLQKLNLVGCRNITSLPKELRWLDEAGSVWTRASGLSKSARRAKNQAAPSQVQATEAPAAVAAAAPVAAPGWRERLSRTWRTTRASSKAHP